MSADRVAEALAALEAADQMRVSYKSGHPQEEDDDRWYRAKELVLAAAPALLKLARLVASHENYSAALRDADAEVCGYTFDAALAELVEVVLGP